MTPAKASVSRMLDFEMPIRERSGQFMRGSSDICGSDLTQEVRFHQFHRFPAPLPVIFTNERVHEVGRWRTALPASMGNEKDVACATKGVPVGAASSTGARPHDSRAPPRNGPFPSDLIFESVENLFATSERHFDSRGRHGLVCRRGGSCAFAQKQQTNK